MKKYIGIYGPTGSGKTALSLEIAKNLKINNIVNFDSCQFFNYLPSLTMRPPVSDYKEYMFGFIEPESPKYSAGAFIKEIEQIEKNNHSSKIFVGGSGFYLLCLLKGISNNAVINNDIMENINKSSMEDNYKKLCELDPNHGLHFKDYYRIKNYLHFFLQNNKSIKDSLSKPVIPEELMFNIFLNPSKEWLINNIEKRTDLMFPHMISEVMEFRKKYENFKTNIIGYKEINEYLNGNITESIAKEKINLVTRQYAKVQRKFLKNKISGDLVIDENYDLNNILDILKQNLNIK